MSCEREHPDINDVNVRARVRRRYVQQYVALLLVGVLIIVHAIRSDDHGLWLIASGVAGAVLGLTYAMARLLIAYHKLDKLDAKIAKMRADIEKVKRGEWNG